MMLLPILKFRDLFHKSAGYSACERMSVVLKRSVSLYELNVVNLQFSYTS